MNAIQTKTPLSINLMHNPSGQYSAVVKDVPCSLELHLDATGCLSGSFVADGETLEIFGGVPSQYGEVFGVMRENAQGDTLAVFRACPTQSGILLEIDEPGMQDLMSLANAECVVFERESVLNTQSEPS